MTAYTRRMLKRILPAAFLFAFALAAYAGAPLKGVDVKLGKNQRTTDANGKADFGVLPDGHASVPNQCAISPFDICYLNKQAFSTAGLGPGIYGTLSPLNILNPGMIQVDMGLSRNFRIRERQTLQFRWEVFNVPNRLNPA